ncbi:TetR/AcrR family transcriptional regulator [Clostridium saccharoperbutylacetonicum]|uniref:TetR/AcrR family transcriptional regulator n=1 Tax=Clostridium saccharoperbutylacetonicum TaxID=36745 RepID=UPI0039EB44B2
MNNTREHILNISFGLFLQKSFKEVTMKEIVEETGMSKGAFYHYFESKEQLFLEIIDYAFSSVIDINYSKLNKDSLYNFYHSYITYLNNVNQLFVQKSSNLNSTFDLNYYSLIFDALRLFPGFREKMIATSLAELEAWKEIVHIARKKEEIKSSMTDEQIASIFINTNSGISMENIMIGRSESITSTLLILWDSFYEDLKV